VHSLQLKVTLGVLLALALALGSASYLHMRLLEKRRLKTIEAETAVLGSSLEGALDLAMLGRRFEELQHTLQRVVQNPEVEKVFILNNRWEVKLSSDSSILGQKFEPGAVRFTDWHTEDRLEPSPAAAAFKRDERSFWSARPIYNRPQCQQCHSPEDEVNGILVMERSLEGFIEEINQEKRELAKLSGGGFAAAALILIPTLNILVVSRLRRLSRRASRIKADDLDHPLTVNGQDEVSTLGHSLEEMRIRLRTSLREVQAGKEYLENLMDALHEGMIVVDHDFRVKQVNRAWSEISGKTAEEILGKPCSQLCSTNSKIPHDCPARACLKSGQEGWALHTITDADGKVRHLEVHCSPLRNEDGEIVEVIEVTRDISRRKQLESQLLHAERLSSVGRLAAGVAHEINNPMASVVTSAEGLQRRYKETQNGQPPPSQTEIDEYLETIRNAGRRCREVTSKLLNFARKDPAYGDLIDFNGLALDALTLVRRSVSDGCCIHMELDPDLPMIMGASGELTQLIFNLLLNAADAVGEKGEIWVITAGEERGIRLKIRDTGTGIPESALPHIFDPFFTTKPPGAGSGLGLFICRGTVDKHHGDIRLDNRAEGGAEVTVYLPLESFSNVTSNGEDTPEEGNS
jgi:PAS domain S-box-containing protein